MKNEIVLYQSNELPERIEVRMDDNTVWLNRQQLSTLFGRDVKTIGKHVNNVFTEGEIVKDMVVAKFATTTQHEAIKRNIERFPNAFRFQLSDSEKNELVAYFDWFESLKHSQRICREYFEVYFC